MPYGAEQTGFNPPPEAWVNRIVDGLAQYYENARDAGIRSRLDIIARSGQGKFTALADRVSAFVSAPRTNAAVNNFFDSCKANVQMKLRQYYANKEYFLNIIGTNIAQTVLETVISKAMTVVPGSASIARFVGQQTFADDFSDHQKKLLNDMRGELGPAAGQTVYTSYVSPDQAKEAAAGAFDSYVNITGMLKNLGGAKPIQTWAEAVTYPDRVFEAEALASDINVKLVALEAYLLCMRSHLIEVQKMAYDYRRNLPATLRSGVNDALHEGFKKGRSKGVDALFAAATRAGGVNKINAFSFPPQAPHSETAGAATQDPASLLALCIANAVTQGVYAGFIDMYDRSLGRPRSGAISGPPVPTFLK